MKKFLFAILTLALVLCLLPTLSQPAEAAGTSVQSEVHLSFKTPYISMPIDQLNATVSDAILESVTIRNAFSEEVVTEGKFETNVVYLIDFVIAPKEGYRFRNFSVLYCGGHLYKNFDPESDGKLHFRYTFTDRTEKVSSAYLELPLLQEGMRTEDLEFTYPKHKNCLLESYKIIDLADQSEVTVLQRGKNYRLQMTFLPIDGYVLSDSFNISLNEKGFNGTCLKSGTYGEGYFDFSLDFGEIALTTLPGDPGGESWSNTTITRCGHPCVKVDAYPSWKDAEKNPVKGDPVGGEVYYLSVKLLVSGPVGLPETPFVTAQGREVTVEVIDETTARVYVRYVADYALDRVEVTSHGIEEGKPLSGVYADVVGNAKITKIKFVENSTILSNIEGKVFEPGKQYRITFNISPTTGYCGGPNSILVFNGHEYDMSNGAISVTKTLDTRYTIDSATASVSGMGVGKTISKVTITSGNKALYRAGIDSWASTNTTSTKFQKGHIYQLHFTLSTDNYEYRFAKNTVITIGGKEAFDLEFSYSDRVVEGIVEFSYLNEVTKVSLPAMPKSIKPRQTLPTNFKVSSSAKYTLQSAWLDMSTQEVAATAGETGCYVLTYVAVAKDGYEFTEDTVFYVDGKKVKPVVLSAYYAQIMKPYNVGLTVVDRIDLTLPEPEHGAVPGEVTVPADAAYAVASVSWGVNTTGKLQDGGDTVTTFQNYKYHFLAVEVQTAPGYMFADKVSVFINGDKYTTLEDINLGVAYQTAVCFGKLGEIAKLTAPELSKDGLLLSWHGVPNADAYEVYRATSKSGKYTKVATVPETAWQDAAAAGKTYYYKVKAIFTPDTTKNSGYSNYVSIVYKCATPTITVENGSTGKPVLSWEKVSGAKKYTVYRATSETGKYTKLGTTSKLTYTDSKAKTGTQYFYKVIANGSSSTYNSSYSNMVSCNVICATPSVTVKIDAATGKPSLSWKKIDAAAGYRILRQLPGEEDFTVIAEQTAVTFKDETAPIDTQCKYMVQTLGKTEALNGNPTKEITATSGIARPSLKTGLDAQGKPVITWEPIEGAVKYEIFRSTKSSKSYKLLVTVETPGYTDESVAPGKTYYYKVVAIGQVSKSAETSYVKLSGKCATPTIWVEAGDSGKPVISWEKISGAKKYTVYRATSETGKYTKLGTTKSLSYTDSKATVGKTYFYKLVANPSSSKYNSAYSNVSGCLTVCATPAVTVKNDAATGKPVLSWKKVTGAVRYEIYLLGAEEYVPLGTVTGTSFRDDTCAPGEGRYYGVRAIAGSEAWNSQVSQPDLGRAACAQPKLKGTVGEAGKPELTWEAVEGATRYAIYRSTSKSSGYKAIDETESLTFTDISAKKGKTYYYKLVALCEDTESAQSAYVKIKSK